MSIVNPNPFDNWTSSDFWSWFGKKHRGTDENDAEGNCNDKPAKPLKLNEKYADCDWHKPSNTQEHRTNEYVRTDNSLVVRRGQPFKFTARLDRPFDKKTDAVKIDLRFGANPSLTNGTHIIVEEKTTQTGWYLTIDSTYGNNVTCSINSPSNVWIGRYKCSIYLQTGEEHVLDEEPDIILLCNPWCKDDDVYLSSEDQCGEYVLNDTGYIWRGTKQYSSPAHWNFGQFEDKILDTALELIMNDKRVQAKQGIAKMADPAWISRILSAAANCSEDDGVLTGNWSGDYEGGVSPVTWNGSVKIIQQYAESKTPVKYGQCWVFSGVTTSLLRALGIPARSVTNFASAHDTDNTMTIDEYVHENNEELKDLKTDSVWNFHVWNEVWLKGTGHWEAKYAGWAAIDATPQESSNGLMQLGPAPIKAIKEGELYVGYDCNFVFGEVNADRVTWVCKKEGDSAIIQAMGARYTGSVGFNISTKAVGSSARHVLTNDYKYPEDTENERKAWNKAYQNSSRPEYFNKFLEVEKGQIKTDISLTPEVPLNGDDVTVNVTVTNLNDNNITVNVNSVLHTCFYTGKKSSVVHKDTKELQRIAAKSEEKFSFTVPFVEYHHRFADDQMSMKVETVVKVVETQNSFSDFIEFQMTNKTNPVKIEFSASSGKVDEKLEAKISFTNPLPIPLTELSITLEGPGLVPPTAEHLSGTIPPLGTAAITATIIPSRSGLRTLMVDIDAKEQKDFKGENSIYINYVASTETFRHGAFS